VIRGFDNLHEQQIKWWSRGKSDTTYIEQAPPDFNSLSSKTILVTQQLAAHRTMPDSKPSEGKLVVTTIWRRLPAGWRVIYCHESCAVNRPPSAGRDEDDPLPWRHFGHLLFRSQYSGRGIQRRQNALRSIASGPSCACVRAGYFATGTTKAALAALFFSR